MSEDSNSKPYRFAVLEGQDGAKPCGSMGQLHRMGGYSQGGANLGLPSDGSDSSGQDNATSPRNHRKNLRSRSLPEEDMEMKSSGSSGSGTESHGNESHGNESHSNDSNGRGSMGSSHSNSKDSALLESSESHKSSNSHSPSPPSSSNAFSLLSSEQDNPSTSGCSSQESAKAKTQKEVIKTLKELKLHLPAEKRHNNKSTTLNTLKYALRCVKQVEANEEYYQLLMTNDSQPSGLVVSSYTIEEIDSITSEYTLKNNDIFAVAVSLITGRIVYISDQASTILNCKRDVFMNTKFVEFLTPQDVSVFYSFTTPYRLPSWSMCAGAESSPSDCMQEKSFFCRISGGKEREGDLQYYPFRMTPYLMKVQDTVHAEDQFCCLLLAERVHSGYDAPRIPAGKQIFTTTHSPSCVFQDVDERAVPLLGYLPQDLIGTSILLHLHPNDRPIMLAIHRKILQCAGQPFDHSSIRFCARNGEYIILDTSWSSFVNPWSRKVSFVIGKHKVRMGPVNEDVFVAPVSVTGEMKTMDPDIQEISEQIHRLLLQPVHSCGSSGYGSMNSADHVLGMTSSTESINNGSTSKVPHEDQEMSSKARPRTFQEICKGVHLQKSQEQQTVKAEKKVSGKAAQKSQAVVRPRDTVAPAQGRDSGGEEPKLTFQEELTFNDQSVCSYQQISCLDSVIRYLEGCNVPLTIKRKCQSFSSSNSDEDKQKGCTNMQVVGEPALLKVQSGLSTLHDRDKKSPEAASGVVGTSLPLSVPNKPESVVSITSQCSYSSTIVHVGDKKPQPESELIEDTLGTADHESSQIPSASPSGVSPPSQERESYKKLGLTKQVLAAHTQKEEQTFLSHFRELGPLTALKTNCSQYLERRKEQTPHNVKRMSRSTKQSGPGGEPNFRRGLRNKKTKLKRAKQVESSDSSVSHPEQQLRPPLLHHGLNPTSWSPSETSQSCFPMAYPAVIPGYPLQVYTTPSTGTPHTDTGPSGGTNNQGCPAPHCTPPIQPHPYAASMVTPVVALLLPNYMYPPLVQGLPAYQAMYPPEAGGCSAQIPLAPAVFSALGPFNFPPPYSVQSQHYPQNTNPPTGLSMPLHFCPPSEMPNGATEIQSCPSTPLSGGPLGNSSPPLFQSPCSSPLNLLELELSVHDSSGNPTVGHGSNNATDQEIGPGGNQTNDRELKQISSRGDGNNSDANSSSSGMFDVILHEDSCSGTGSATSGSMGSASNGCGTSSGTSNSRTSKSRASASGGSASGISGSRAGSDSSKYFGSVDSSQNSQKVKVQLSSIEGRPLKMDQTEHIIKSELQDPMWLLMANTDDKVMMTYQQPSRDIHEVLKEDKDKLKVLQNTQPRFTEEQKKELIEVHPWLKKGNLPRVIDVKMCSCCDDASEFLSPADAEDQPDMEMGDTETVDLFCRRTDESSDTFASCHTSAPSSQSPPRQ